MVGEIVGRMRPPAPTDVFGRRNLAPAGVMPVSRAAALMLRSCAIRTNSLRSSMFTRSAFNVSLKVMSDRGGYRQQDMGEQGRVLGEVARLADAGRLRTTLTERLSTINAADLKQAHGLVESARMQGKVVLEGWD